MTTRQETFYNWLNLFLKDRGLQFSKSGFKGGASIGRHVISNVTGFWDDVQYSGGKPPRWLFQIDWSDEEITARIPAGLDEIGIGASNTAQGDKAGLALRILPLLRTDDEAFSALDNFEINALFIFHGPLSAGSSSDGFSFNPESGVLKRLGNPVDYILAALIGLHPATDTMTVTVGGRDRVISYGDVLNAIGAAISICREGEEIVGIPIYDLSTQTDLDRLKADVDSAWTEAGPAPVRTVVAATDEVEVEAEPLDFANLEVPENPDLLGINPAVYRQINALLKSGKHHLMLYGPPGTGKTSLARWIANSLPGGDWTLITGSSDWSSQDIIGGYQPVGGGDVDFVPGILLREFDHPLIIDELNRCDIDKVIGPLFTLLSGQQTTLPYRTDITDKESLPYTILPKPKADVAPHEFAPGPGWRLIATINSIDKASLYQVSYALSRRFGWVYVDVPYDLAGFVASYLTRLDPVASQPRVDQNCPLADLWAAINTVRLIGPAPIIDCILAIRAINADIQFFGPASPALRNAVLDALDMVLLPMLDGILRQDALSIANSATSAFALDEAQKAQVTARLEAVAV